MEILSVPKKQATNVAMLMTSKLTLLRPRYRSPSIYQRMCQLELWLSLQCPLMSW